MLIAERNLFDFFPKEIFDVDFGFDVDRFFPFEDSPPLLRLPTVKCCIDVSVLRLHLLFT